jgi:hypothetical protein
MTEKEKRAGLLRMAVGALAGLILHLLLGCLLGCFSLTGPVHFTGFIFPDCNISRWNFHLEWLGVLLSFSLWALFGVEVAAATLPFAENGKQLVLRSLLHFGAMAATLGVWVGLNLGWMEVPPLLLVLTLIYALIWLIRWVGWYAELLAMRKKLGLSPSKGQARKKEDVK